MSLAFAFFGKDSRFGLTKVFQERPTPGQ
jgi:hypothetical protein